MKNLIIAVVTFIFFFNPLVVHAADQSEILQRVDSDIQIANTLLDNIDSVQDDPQAILEVLLRDIPSVTQHLNDSSRYYESLIATESDEELKAILRSVNNDINGLSSSLLMVEAAINADDADSYLSALEEFDSYAASLNTNVEALNNHFGVADYSWLAWPFWLALPFSIILFIKSRGSPLLPADQLRKKYEFELFKSSLWPTIGSAVSYLWYLLTPAGGTFYVLYGPIIIGYFQFFRGLYTYITQARPAINLASSEEKSKLEALIRSDKLAVSSIEDQAEKSERQKVVHHLHSKDSDKK
jgi:hypothetical protein